MSLTLIRDIRPGAKSLYRCGCGAEVLRRRGDVDRRPGADRSCGCRWPTRAHIKHGDSRAAARAPEWQVWIGIISRCTNPTDKAYARYGGRGIRVCEQWRNSYPAFLAYMGRKPSPRHSIDRIDNDGNYEAGNCRWATPKEQARNRSTSVVTEVDGVALTLVEIAERSGLKYTTVKMRYSHGKRGGDLVAPVGGAS